MNLAKLSLIPTSASTRTKDSSSTRKHTAMNTNRIRSFEVFIRFGFGLGFKLVIKGSGLGSHSTIALCVNGQDLNFAFYTSVIKVLIDFVANVLISFGYYLYFHG